VSKIDRKLGTWAICSQNASLLPPLSEQAGAPAPTAATTAHASASRLVHGIEGP
jgi:hypothetical protein